MYDFKHKIFRQPFWSEIGIDFFAILAINRVWFLDSNLKLGMFFFLEDATFSGHKYDTGKMEDFGHK